MPKTRKGRKRAGRKVKLTNRSKQILEAQRSAFREKFGRDPGPDDPVFFDPDADEPKPLEEDPFQAEVLRAMDAAGLPPQFIFAYVRTGLIVTASNKDSMPEEDLAEWDAAIDEYFRLEDEAGRNQQ